MRSLTEKYYSGRWQPCLDHCHPYRTFRNTNSVRETWKFHLLLGGQSSQIILNIIWELCPQSSRWNFHVSWTEFVFLNFMPLRANQQNQYKKRKNTNTNKAKASKKLSHKLNLFYKQTGGNTRGSGAWFQYETSYFYINTEE